MDYKFKRKIHGKHFPGRLARKILNELKYNKRLIHIWNEFLKIEIKDGNYLETLSDKIKSVIDNLDNLLNEEISDYKALQLLKKIDCSDVKVNRVVSFNKVKSISCDKILFNDFISIDLNSFLISSIWVETVGIVLNDSFNTSIYANRVENSTNNFFKLYFSAYNDYRNDAFKEMNYIVDNSATGVTIQFDIEQCFYHVDIDFLSKKVSKYLHDSNLSQFDFSLCNKLNNYIFNLINNYELNKKSNHVLPIGFLPSNILINFYLLELDKLFVSELNPLSYGRYVDDVTIVIKTDFDTYEEETVVGFLRNKVEKIVETFNHSKKKNNSKHNEFHINPNIDKVIYFIMSKNNDVNYVKKFKNITSKLSSDFYRLIDVNELEPLIDSAYKIVDNPIKLEELFKITKDKKVINRVSATVLYSIFSEPIVNSSYNVKLALNFIEKYEKFVDNKFFLEMYDYWFTIILIECVAKNLHYTSLSKKLFNNLIVIRKLIALKKEFRNDQTNDSTSQRKVIKFIDLYISLFEKILTSKSSSCQELLYNFIYPKYLNNMYQNDLILNYDQQLKKLHQLDNSVHNAGKNNIDKKWIETNLEQINDITLVNLKMKKEDMPYIDYDKKQEGSFKDSIRVSQVSEPNPTKRIKEFIKFSKNTNKRSNLIKALNDADQQKSDILIFPEQGVNINDILLLMTYAKRTKTVIIGGFDYYIIGKYVLNLSFSIVPFITADDKLKKTYNDCGIYLCPKRFPSPSEYDTFLNSCPISNQVQEREIYIPNSLLCGINFKYRGYKHSILNCYEAADLKIKSELVKFEPDLVHLITNNKDIHYYESISEIISRELMAITTTTNYSIYGGIELFVPKKERFKQIVSYHKGSDSQHVITNLINVGSLLDKKHNNNNIEFRQNPPRIYYRNIGKDLH